MKMMFALCTLMLATACNAVPKRAAYLNVTSMETSAEEAMDFGPLPGVELGLLLGEADDPADRITGLVGDVAVVGSKGSDDWCGSEVDVESIGLRTGLRYYFDTGSSLFQPYLGGALLVEHFWFSDESSEDEAGALGFVGMAGVESAIGEHLRLNLGYQLTSGIRPRLDGEAVDFDTRGFLLGLGWSF